MRQELNTQTDAIIAVVTRDITLMGMALQQAQSRADS